MDRQRCRSGGRTEGDAGGGLAHSIRRLDARAGMRPARLRLAGNPRSAVARGEGVREGRRVDQLQHDQAERGAADRRRVYTTYRSRTVSRYLARLVLEQISNRPVLIAPQFVRGTEGALGPEQNWGIGAAIRDLAVA